MTKPSETTSADRTSPKRQGPRLFIVSDAWRLTPNMIRVVFAGEALADLPANCDGANCKLFIPELGEDEKDFANRLATGSRLTKRTYTVRNFDPHKLEMIIDFVAHGDDGPASAWASRAKPGDFLGFGGPSKQKVTEFEADWYLVAADPSAIPVAAATLEAMPRDAKGVAIFEVTSAEDRQDIDIPSGFDVHWLVHPDPNSHSSAQEDLIRSLSWPAGRVQTCIAGESNVIRALRIFVVNEKLVSKTDAYISGYWKIGLIEDEHQKAKRTD